MVASCAFGTQIQESGLPLFATMSRCQPNVEFSMANFGSLSLLKGPLMTSHRATIYSNGIADFQRVFKVEKGDPKTISIPVRQQHLGDVLASLTVSGLVKIDSPPSFQPANQDETNIHIDTCLLYTSPSPRDRG